MIIKLVIKQRPAAVVGALLSFAFMLVMVFSRGTAWRDWTYTLVAAASLTFVATAFAGGAHKHGYGMLMAAGLIGCCLGDLLGPYDFVWGALAFLVSHVAFIAAFLVLGIRWKRSAVAVVPVFVAGIGIGLWLMPHVPRAELWLVMLYMLVISVMLVLAYGVRTKAVYGFLVSGATLFYVSDIFVARWQYVAPGSINAWFCYPMYYSACILLALSVAALTASNESRA